MTQKRILITAPSLDVNENVSGISSLVTDIMRSSRNSLAHFKMGSRDGLRKDISWAIKQLGIYVKLVATSFTRRFEIVHLNMGLEKFSIIRDSIAFFCWKNIFRKKIILHVHGGYFLMHEPASGIIRYLLIKVFKHADRIIVLSEIEKDILSARYGELNFAVFPNAVNMTAIARNPRIYNNEKLRLVFLGRINKSKGIYTITESLPWLTNYFDQFELVIYGAGPELNNWMESLHQFPGLQFAYKGVTGGKEKWEVLRRADVFLLPSLHSEGMPVAMLEAMAAGCVVMVSDVASVRTVINNNHNGILLPVNQPKELAQRIIDAIEGKYNLKQMGEQAQEYVNAHLSFSGYVKKLDNLYASM